MGRHRLVRGLVGLSFLITWLPAASAAETPPPGQDAAPVLDAVLVSPRRIPGRNVRELAYPGAATVLTAEDIARLHAQSLTDVLAQTEGVSLFDQQGFGLGADGTVNLRGIVNSSRTNALVLVDGVRQNRITGDEVHWLSIPVEQIERVEILRGGGGLVYGEGALAGVINITTKHDADRPVETEHTVEAGAFGWQRYHTGVQGRVRPLSYDFAATRGLVDGYRDSSWSRATILNAHAGLDVTDTLSATLHVLHSEDTTAFPGTLTLAQTERDRRTTNAFHGFNTNDIDQVSLDFVGGPWEGLSSVATLYWRRRLQTSEDSIAFNSFTTTPSHGASLRGNHEWAGDAVRNLLVGGVELMDDKATTGDRDAFAGPDSESHRHGYGVYLEDTLTLWERASLTLGARFDQFRFEESLVFPSFTGTLRFQGWSPKVAASYAVVPDVLHVFASYARPFKSPNVDDFSVRTVDFTGNPDLKPQEADTYEAGVKFQEGGARAAATAFYTRIDEEILTNGLVLQNQNFDTRRVGAELSVRLAPPGGRWRAHAVYMFVDAEFRKGQFLENTIPATPEHTFQAGLGVSPWESLWIDLDWRLVHDFFRVNDMNNVLGGADNYGVLDLLVRYDLPTRRRARGGPAWGAYLKVLNLTNEEYVTFASSNGTNLLGAGEAPMPPLSILVGATLSF
jgi:iron complex outermembrane receptor protein